MGTPLDVAQILGLVKVMVMIMRSVGTHCSQARPSTTSTRKSPSSWEHVEEANVPPLQIMHGERESAPGLGSAYLKAICFQVGVSGPRMNWRTQEHTRKSLKKHGRHINLKGSQQSRDGISPLPVEESLSAGEM